MSNIDKASPFYLDFDAVCWFFYGRTGTGIAEDLDFAPDPMELAKAIKEDEGL